MKIAELVFRPIDRSRQNGVALICHRFKRKGVDPPTEWPQRIEIRAGRFLSCWIDESDLPDGGNALQQVEKALIAPAVNGAGKAANEKNSHRQVRMLIWLVAFTLFAGGNSKARIYATDHDNQQECLKPAVGPPNGSQ